MPEPDLKGIPEVVAKVNGEEIPKKEFVTAYESQFQQAAMQAQMSGQKLDQDKMKDQTLNNLVGTELLVQEASDRGIEPSQKQMDKTLGEIAKQNQLKSTDKLMDALKKQGYSEKDVQAQLEKQVTVEQLISAETGNVKISDQEIKDAYEKLKAQQEKMGQSGGQGGKLPSLEDARPQLEKQLKSQKEGQAAQGLVTELRKDAKVTINL